MDATSLIDRYCAVWAESDAGRRAELLAAVWSPRATYTDPTVHAAGADELLGHIARVRERYPDVRIARTSQVDMHHGMARFAWHVVLADGSALPDGLDVAFLSADGTRIERIVGFFGPLARG